MEIKDTQNVIRTGDSVDALGPAEALTDLILKEMSDLYRERFQAMQVNDGAMVGLINHQINGLREKLEKL